VNVSSTDASTASVRDTGTTIDDEASKEDDGPKIDDDGMLDGIVSEFDEI
jgi:hypothetical protein